MILADPAAAEDALHQVFLKLLKTEYTPDAIGNLDHYLHAAVRNEAYRLLRNRPPRTTNFDRAEPFLEPADPAARDEERRTLETALRALPPDQREVVHLKIYENLTFQRIADRLNLSPNTAASRYRYALEKLKSLLEDSSP